MTKEEWIAEATINLVPFLGEQSGDYAEGLYEDYVTNCPGHEFDPDEAVSEDMSYWDDDGEG